MQNFIKILLPLFFFTLSINIYAQSPCEFAINVTDSAGTYKSTKEFLVHERNLGLSESYIFLSLINSDGTPLLSVKTIQKSSEFISANCMNEYTKVIFQLLDGKIITLLHNSEESCGNYAQNPDDKKNVRFNSGLFLFLKGTMENLQKSPITFMRLQYATGNVDYVIPKEIMSAFTKTTEFPEQFFINNLKCVE